MRKWLTALVFVCSFSASAQDPAPAPPADAPTDPAPAPKSPPPAEAPTSAVTTDETKPAKAEPPAAETPAPQPAPPPPAPAEAPDATPAEPTATPQSPAPAASPEPPAPADPAPKDPAPADPSPDLAGDVAGDAAPPAASLFDLLAPPGAAMGTCLACGAGSGLTAAALAVVAVVSTGAFCPYWYIFQAFLPFVFVGIVFSPSCVAGGLGPIAVGGASYLAGLNLDESARRMIAFGALPGMALGALASLGVIVAVAAIVTTILLGSGPFGPTSAIGLYALGLGLFAGVSMWAANVLAPAVSAAGVVSNAAILSGFAPDLAPLDAAAPPAADGVSLRY